MKATVLPAGETAYLLRRALGPICEWSDCLSDMRRGIRDLEGLVLLPSGRCHDGRKYRPVYSHASIRDFIFAVSDRRKGMNVDAPLQGFQVELDPTDTCSWKVRTLERLH
jgi:hypothetical protein